MSVASAVPTTIDTVVVEWAAFRLAEGVSEPELVRASDTLQRDFLAHQPGFIRRELLRGANNQWVDLVYWADSAAAERVMAAAMESPVCHTYFRLMEAADAADPAAGVLHFDRLKSYS